MYKLRKTVGDLSGGTAVELLASEDLPVGQVRVRTVSPVPVVKHHSWFDEHGKQRHHQDIVRAEHRQLTVDADDLVETRRR